MRFYCPICGEIVYRALFVGPPLCCPSCGYPNMVNPTLSPIRQRVVAIGLEHEFALARARAGDHAKDERRRKTRDAIIGKKIVAITANYRSHYAVRITSLTLGDGTLLHFCDADDDGVILEIYPPGGDA